MLVASIVSSRLLVFSVSTYMGSSLEQVSLDPESDYTLLRQLSQDFLPYEPHDISIKALVGILNRNDVLVRTGCGSGKTGIIAFLALALPRIHEIIPSFKPWFHDNPVLLVICPTNTLELDIESKLRKLEVDAVALNADILHVKVGTRCQQAH
ncbi:hypothetical protein F5880DRAFT_1601213 [Lentinula raphanica]|nr:hypothetical protein F5880DRAFT_1601213 [Lentinula raphanica]